MRVRLILIWLVWLVSCATNPAPVSPFALPAAQSTPDTTRTPAWFYTPTPLAADPRVNELLVNLAEIAGRCALYKRSNICTRTRSHRIARSSPTAC